MYTEDGSIVHQCLSGNTEAFALLVEKYKARVFALVYAKVGGFEDAEDIAQDVFIEAYRRLSTLRRWDNFYPWLYSIASNQCKNFHRARGRRIDTVSFDEHTDNHQADMDAHAEKLRNEQIHDALDSLPEIHRQVLVLRYMAGMRSKEIAQTLRVSPNTVNQRLMRARTQLKAVLNEEAIPMIPTAFAERKLQPGFTARIIELIKGTQIQTAPHKTALPLGLSAAGGVILLLLSLSIPQSPLYPVGEWLGGPLPLKTQAFKNGELAVDAAATEVAILGGEQADGSFGQQPNRHEIPAVVGQAEEPDKKEAEITQMRFPDTVDLTWSVDASPDGKKIVYTGSRSTSSGFSAQLFVQTLVDVTTNVSLEPTVLVEEEFAVYYQPKWSPDGQWIAFYRMAFSTETLRFGTVVPKAAQDIDVYLVNASGGEPRFLAHTESDKHPGWPSWSPDGTELAFVKPKGRKGSDIYIVSVGTGEVRPLTTDGKENTAPYWWPDGKSIAYESRRGIRFSDSSNVWKQRVDGGKAVKMNRRVYNTYDLIHSPDGKWVAYTSRLQDGRSGFLASSVNAEDEITGEPILLKTARLQVGAKPLRWTPDGKIIVLQENYTEATYSISAISGVTHRLSSNPALPFDYGRWLSDGKRLFLPYYDRNRGPGFYDLETSQFTELSHESLKAGYREPTISPDGQQLAFVRTSPRKKRPTHETSDELWNVNAHLYIMPVASGLSTQLTHGESSVGSLRWSPDGRQIACVLMKIGESGDFNTQLCVVSVADGQVKTLTDSGFCLTPTWSPDGSTIAYLRLEEQLSLSNLEQSFADFEDMEVSLYVMPADGGESNRIASSPQHPLDDENLNSWTPDGRISWTPDGKWVTFEIHGLAWVTSVEGGEPIPLQRKYVPGSWSSDGQSYLAFGWSGELRRVSLDGTTHSELPVRVPKNAHPLSMSPDGETILYRRTASGTQCWKIDVSHLVSQ